MKNFIYILLIVIGVGCAGPRAQSHYLGQEYTEIKYSPSDKVCGLFDNGADTIYDSCTQFSELDVSFKEPGFQKAQKAYVSASGNDVIIMGECINGEAYALRVSSDMFGSPTMIGEMGKVKCE